MLIEDDSIYLYHLTLRSPSLSQYSLLGQFLGTKKSQELLLANSTFIELWKPISDTGKVQKILVQNTLGIIQSVGTLRLPGSQKDFLVITSDSGNIVIAEYDELSNNFIPRVQEPHSKNGFRRITPGEYLSIDPHNRAVMISAIEKNKLVYKVSSNAEGQIELSSPLEASTRELLTLQTCALDTGFDNPMFAAIEIDYSEYESQDGSSSNRYDPQNSPLILNYYELDQGLNHIVKKKANGLIPASSTCLIPLPGHIGGLLISCQSFLIYDHLQRERLYLPLPIREGSSETIITSHVTHKLKKNKFFILCQSSLGDLFKITVDYNEAEEKIECISVKYFDTIPFSNSLNISKSGFLFANSSNNNKHYYQFEDLAEDDDETTLKSSGIKDSDIANYPLDSRLFKLKALENLALVDIIETLHPVIDATLLETKNNLTPDPSYQILTLSSHSYLKKLTYGFPTSTIVSEPCPKLVPTSVFTTKISFESTDDQYLILSSSLSSETLVFSIGEDIDLVDDSEFVTSQNTIAVQQIGKSSIVQVHADGIRHIKHIQDGDIIKKKTTDWVTPGGISILKAGTNNEQVIIGLSNREIRYFEVDPVDDQLKEYGDTLEISSGNITSLAISPILDSGNRKSPYAIVGSSDETVQVISLLDHNMLEILTIQALSANSSSIQILTHERNTYVHIGMENGLYVKTLIDDITGKLSDSRIKYLGSMPVQLSTIGLPQIDQTGILAISSRPWIGYHNKGAYNIAPLMDTSMNTAVSIHSEALGGDGIVGISDGKLTILTLNDGTGEEAVFDLDNDFTVSSLPLRYTPKRMITDKSTSGTLIHVIESEYGIKSPFPKTVFQSDKEDTEQDGVDQDYYQAFGYEKSEGSWASCVQTIDYDNNSIIQSIEFGNNQAAISLCQVSFESHPNKEYLIIGVTEDQRYLPNLTSKNYLFTFEIKKKKHDQANLEFVHETSIEGPPTAIIPFKGKLLVGMKNYLRLYDLGQRQLLRKASSTITHLTTIVKLIHQGGDVVVSGDARHSTTFIKYDSITNQFIPFCDDIMQRQITALATLDSHTIIGGDKFGNCFVSRLSNSALQQITDDINLRYQESHLNGSSSRSRNLCEFYLQDIPTSFFKGSMTVGGLDSIFYTGLQGTIGMLMPVITKSEIEMLSKLETLLREFFSVNFDDFDKDKNGYNLLGKDHLTFRSYYNPVKNVIDGDFIEKFYELNISQKIKISTALDRTPKEIEKKISDLRIRSAF